MLFMIKKLICILAILETSFSFG